MRFLLDEMYSECVCEHLRRLDHDAVHVREVGLGGAIDAVVLVRAVEGQRTLVTENAADFVALLERRQGAGLEMIPVLLATTSGRGAGGALHARLARRIDTWAKATSEPYAHIHWLP